MVPARLGSKRILRKNLKKKYFDNLPSRNFS